MTLSESATGDEALPRVNGSAHPAASMFVITPGTRKRPRIRQYSAAVRERVRQLVTETDLSIDEIASVVGGPAATTINNWMRAEGWPRPAAAPQLKRRHGDPAALTRHGRMMLRLERALSRQLKGIEKRAGNAENAEKDARALAVIAKTYETLTALGRDDEGRTKEPEPQDRADVTARLAERIARWAEGRTGPA